MNAEAFQQASQLVTQGFAECSTNIRAIAATLTEKKRDDLSQMIRAIQTFERDKLRFVCCLCSLCHV